MPHINILHLLEPEEVGAPAPPLRYPTLWSYRHYDRWNQIVWSFSLGGYVGYVKVVMEVYDDGDEQAWEAYIHTPRKSVIHYPMAAKPTTDRRFLQRWCEQVIDERLGNQW